MMPKKTTTGFEIDPILSELIDTAPSIIRNSAIVGTVRIVTFIIGVLLFLGGIGMIIDSQIQAEFFNEWMHDLYDIPLIHNRVTTNLILFAGIAATAMGILFLFISRLTRMILKRNRHNMALFARKNELLELIEAERKLAEEKISNSQK